jgi:nucleoside-diphosphate-sugar epimerase
MGKTNVVFGNPNHRLPLNYVENLIDAMQMAAASGEGLRQFNVVDDDELTLGRYHEVRRSVDGSATRFCSAWPMRIASPFAEALRLLLPMGDTRLSHRIREETGWRPRVPLLEAVQRTVNAPAASKR